MVKVSEGKGRSDKIILKRKISPTQLNTTVKIEMGASYCQYRREREIKLIHQSPIGGIEERKRYSASVIPREKSRRADEQLRQLYGRFSNQGGRLPEALFFDEWSAGDLNRQQEEEQARYF